MRVLATRLLRPGPLVWALAWMVLGVPTTAQLSAAPPPQRGWLDPLRYYDQLRQTAADLPRPEIVEMVSAIANGSQMGPGDGWFHESQSRYSWKWLAGRYDTDHKGIILRRQFFGPSEIFDRLDRNHDGALTASDFDWSDRSLFAMQSMPSRYWFGWIDGDSNGRITKEEWEAWFNKLSKGKGFLTQDDLREGFPTSPPPRRLDAPPPPPPQASGPSPATLFKGLLAGELGSYFEGPAIGQRAPDFELKTQDGSKTIRLSQFQGKKPVMLVFGSFT
jgi:hypothetical protein